MRHTLFAFQIPSGSLFFMNLLLAVGTGIILMLIIRSQPNIGATLTGKTIISLLVRVSVAVGLEWISGLLCYFIPTSTIIQYTFIILVSLHGLWVLISTLTLESVREKWIRGFVKKIAESRISQVSVMTDLTDAKPGREGVEAKNKVGGETLINHVKALSKDCKNGQIEVSTKNLADIQTSDNDVTATAKERENAKG